MAGEAGLDGALFSIAKIIADDAGNNSRRIVFRIRTNKTLSIFIEWYYYV